jgi:hypothetical protein
MKTLNFLRLSLIAMLCLGACSPRVSNERVDKLEGRQTLLEKTAELNKLNLEMERHLVKEATLMEAVEKINREASASAGDAEDLSRRVSRNPGNSRLANKAERASRRAAKDARRARKLNNQLNDVNNKIRKLRKDISETQRELLELQGRVAPSREQ